MASDNDKRVTFEELVAGIRKDAPGRNQSPAFAPAQGGEEIWKAGRERC